MKIHHYSCGCIVDNHDGNEIYMGYTGSCIDCARKKIAEITNEILTAERERKKIEAANSHNEKQVNARALNLAVDAMHLIAAKAWKDWRSAE